MQSFDGAEVINNYVQGTIPVHDLGCKKADTLPGVFTRSDNNNTIGVLMTLNAPQHVRDFVTRIRSVKLLYAQILEDTIDPIEMRWKDIRITQRKATALGGELKVSDRVLRNMLDEILGSAYCLNKSNRHLIHGLLQSYNDVPVTPFTTYTPLFASKETRTNAIMIAATSQLDNKSDIAALVSTRRDRMESNICGDLFRLAFRGTHYSIYNIGNSYGAFCDSTSDRDYTVCALGYLVYRLMSGTTHEVDSFVTLNSSDRTDTSIVPNDSLTDVLRVLTEYCTSGGNVSHFRKVIDVLFSSTDWIRRLIVTNVTVPMFSDGVTGLQKHIDIETFMPTNCMLRQGVSLYILDNVRFTTHAVSHAVNKTPFVDWLSTDILKQLAENHDEDVNKLIYSMDTLSFLAKDAGLSQSTYVLYKLCKRLYDPKRSTEELIKGGVFTIKEVTGQLAYEDIFRNLPYNNNGYAIGEVGDYIVRQQALSTEGGDGRVIEIAQSSALILQKGGRLKVIGEGLPKWTEIVRQWTEAVRVIDAGYGTMVQIDRIRRLLNWEIILPKMNAWCDMVPAMHTIVEYYNHVTTHYQTDRLPLYEHVVDHFTSELVQNSADWHIQWDGQKACTTPIEVYNTSAGKKWVYYPMLNRKRVLFRAMDGTLGVYDDNTLEKDHEFDHLLHPLKLEEIRENSDMYLGHEWVFFMVTKAYTSRTLTSQEVTTVLQWRNQIVSKRERIPDSEYIIIFQNNWYHNIVAGWIQQDLFGAGTTSLVDKFGEDKSLQKMKCGQITIYYKDRPTNPGVIFCPPKELHGVWCYYNVIASAVFIFTVGIPSGGEAVMMNTDDEEFKLAEVIVYSDTDSVWHNDTAMAGKLVYMDKAVNKYTPQGIIASITQEQLIEKIGKGIEVDKNIGLLRLLVKAKVGAVRRDPLSYSTQTTALWSAVRNVSTETAVGTIHLCKIDNRTQFDELYNRWLFIDK